MTNSAPENPGDTIDFSVAPETVTAGGLLARLRRAWLGLTLAALAYIPLLLSARGRISADTKAYLYLDPGRLLDRAWLMWNTHVDAGTVTHENIGYMFPLGPYYWLMHQLGMPTWIAERLCFGTILFAAGYGAVWMLRRLGLRGGGVAVGGFVYMLSPYILAYFGRTSVILLPWSALPWLIGLMAIALRTRTWRAPVLAALIITLMAGTNASSVIFVLIAPALLVPYMIWVTKEVQLRAALMTIVRFGVTTAPAQLWWVAGLWVQGAYGLPVLQLTETVQTIAMTSTPAELMRGLGYWYFYGRDGVSQWTESSKLYTTNLLMFVVGFILPTLALVGAVLTRWRYRAYFIGLVVVGLVAGIGVHPYDDPTPIGSVVKATTTTAAGMALRNSSRALPLLVLGLAVLLASFVEPATGLLRSRVRVSRHRAVGPVLVGSLIVIALLALPPIWTGGLIQHDLQFPDPLPSYWTDAAQAIDATSDGSRLLELPGTDFYTYRWGLTQDPITPGITDRPWVGRELTAYGAPATADLIRALDVPIQEHIADPASIAPIARLFSASDVLLRMDTLYERYHAPRPADLWADFGGANGLAALGLGRPTTFGHPTPFVVDPRQPTIDEYELSRPASSTLGPPLALFPVTGDVRPIVRSESAAGALVVWGNGTGLVDAAGAGLLSTRGAILYAASLSTDDTAAAATRAGTPSLLITDTNRRQGSRWGTTRDNTGATEAAGSTPLTTDARDYRLAVFPGVGDEYYTVAEYGPDVADVRATNYGAEGAYAVDRRPVSAIDGDPRTAWTTGDAQDVVGNELRIDYRHPVTADHIDLTQLRGNRFITAVSVLLDGKVVTRARLNDSSFAAPGQRIDLGGDRTFHTLEIRIDDANITGLVSYSGIDNVGLTEVTVPGVQAAEWIRVPSAGLDRFGNPSSHLSYLFTRVRANPIEAWRRDGELHMARIFTMPRSSVMSLASTARLSGNAPSQRIDRLIGRPSTESGYASVDGDIYLFGDLRSRPSSALDGDPTTAWQTPFGGQVGTGFTVVNPAPTTIDHLRLSVLADGRHSVPTALALTGDDGVEHIVEIPAIADSTELGATSTVDVSVPTMTTTRLRVAIAAEREVLTQDPFTPKLHALPVGIVDLGLPHLVGPVPASMPDTCHADAFSIDGTSHSIRLAGTTADAIARRALQVVDCGSSTVELGAGDHTLLTANGLDTGIDIDQTRIDSPGAATMGGSGAATITADPTGRLSYRVASTGGSGPYWLVLGQSVSAGWHASVRGGPDLGPPLLIDGFANGWQIDPAVLGPDLTIDLVWTPQGVVNKALVVSAIWFLGLLVAAGVLALRRRRQLAGATSADELPLVPSEFTGVVARTTASVRARLVAVALASVLTWAIGGAIAGAGVLVISLIASSSVRRRALLLATPVITMGGVVVLYVAGQLKRGLPTGVEWPNGFLFADQLVLIAVGCVVAECLLRYAARIRPASEQTASAANQSSAGSADVR